MTTPRPDPRIGTTLGPYRIERVLGRGGMGVVYLAEQRELRRKVALKLLPDELAHDADFRARFERESRLAAAIDHPNVIPLYEAGEIEGTLYLAMRYVEGTDLATRLREGELPFTTALAILSQVAGALDVAHEGGLVHRDVKPGNVLLARTAQGEHAYLTDFGLTKLAGSDSGLTRAGAFMGTPAYMAPEQIEGRDIDGRADQYSLAAMAFEALTGEVPFSRDQEIAIAMAHLRDPIPSAVALRGDLPPAVDAVFPKAMAKDPADRYADCGTFMADLQASLTERADPGQVAAPDRTRQRLMPIRLTAVIGTVLVVLAAAGIVSSLGSSGASIASPSDSARAAVATSPPPDPSASPDDAEATLLTKVPADLRDRCFRGPKTPIVSELGSSTTPLAALRCTVGNFSFVIRQLDPKGLSASDVLRRVIDARDLPAGDCEVSTPAVGPWRQGDREIGTSACYLSGVDAIIEWTYEDEGLFARATIPYSDLKSAVAWWVDTRELIGSDQLGVQAPFPGPAEAALIRMLPASLAADCDRGSYARPAPALAVKPIASIRCPLPPGPGATVIELRQISDLDDVRASDVLAASGIAGGGCPPPSLPDGRWSIAGQDIGAVACYRDNVPNAIIDWTYDEAGILARARRPDSDSLAMFDWWQANAPALAP